MHKLIVVFGLALAAACGGGDKKAAPTGPTAPAGATLGLAEMKIVDISKNDAVLIHADGRIEYDGKVVAKVTTDGKLIRQDTGEVVMQLQADGSISSKAGDMPPVIISADGSATLEGKTVSIDASGNLVGANAEAPKVRIEGATDGRTKRTALFILLALSTPSSEGESKSGPTPTAPPADEAKPPSAMPMPKK